MTRDRSPLETRWHAWWAGLAPREQRLVGAAALLVGLALLWWVALAPALRTLAQAPAAHAQLDAQLQQMGALQAQAQTLQAQPRAHREESLRALEGALRQSLGTNAQMQASGGDAVGVALRAAPADTLGAWFAQARANARALPREVHLTRSQAAPAAGAAPGAASASATPSTDSAGGPTRIHWDGTVVLSLPAP